jgi:hypothetical protein
MKFFCLATILACLAASTAAADVVVDQEHVGPTTVAYSFDYPGDYMAQTFTLRNSGQLTSIGLQISQPNAPYPTSPLQLQLTRTNSAGEPDIANVLATSSISPSVVTHDYSGLPMIDVDLRSQHVQVQSGDQLAIVVSSSDLHYDWSQSLWFDESAGGKFFVYSPKTFGARWFYQWNTTDPTATADAGYRITIDTVPEPSAILLATLAIAALISLPHRAPRT